jgi:hypothetical protein
MDTGRQDKDLAKLQEELKRLEELAPAVEAGCSRGQKSQKEDEAARDAIPAWLRL